ncbi:MAG TPA: PTS lactose/cellobiose transporter subunit IIA [Symbiobacteriaceae bacterium]|nr:PTS lactose/cellobiose transporter subunit IIA [Symbiobacteriaceae bacterium]
MVDLEQTSMLLIIHSGNARTCAYEGFDLALAGDYAAAKAKLQEATGEISKAHAQQTSLIQNEAAGNGTPPSLLLVHAQDHLMTAMVEVNLMERLVRMMEVRR